MAKPSARGRCSHGAHHLHGDFNEYSCPRHRLSLAALAGCERPSPFLHDRREEPTTRSSRREGEGNDDREARRRDPRRSPSRPSSVRARRRPSDLDTRWAQRRAREPPGRPSSNFPFHLDPPALDAGGVFFFDALQWHSRDGRPLLEDFDGTRIVPQDRRPEVLQWEDVPSASLARRGTRRAQAMGSTSRDLSSLGCIPAAALGPGHEGSGVVEAVGPNVTEVKRVTAWLLQARWVYPRSAHAADGW